MYMNETEIPFSPKKRPLRWIMGGGVSAYIYIYIFVCTSLDRLPPRVPGIHFAAVGSGPVSSCRVEGAGLKCAARIWD